ncbi:hypothetical protein SAMN05421762_0956 [Pseudooceanicola nitratireducens]|jgi:hypothetical protein|uniref:Uncharacterized protein n=1 Tax=Pseudooceanicola nitratireducens TaxID=517719 RepID=A0A1I1JA60_9RHOB|nr:hypothetical protein [Pseudooceanicola nitratireducens]SEJ30489.1 hypothetical protein SAMN05216183_102952 [Pseudooceanicola nitratireducens]SFC45346.1 hypothetical protein SAMN05421762_0956 [Pseudooceanicola nitratireducens]
MSEALPPDEEFVITDPDQQPGVVFEVEPGIRPAMLEGYLSEKMVRCSFCKQRQRHRKGCFALLPEVSKALCDHCCAVEFTDKVTVAKIEKDLDRRVAQAEQRKISGAVFEGVPQLIEILDRDLIPIEQSLQQVMEELERIFPALRRRKPPKLAVACGGLATILKAADEKLIERRIEEILRKRGLVNDAIREGFALLQESVKAISPDRIRSRFRGLAEGAGYEEMKMSGNVMVAGKWDTHLGEYDFWETTYEGSVIIMPDTTEIRGLMEGV